MCVGIPMQILESREGCAICERNGEKVTVNTLLTGDLPQGQWVLVFQNSAVRVMTEEEARQTLLALSALEQTLAGETPDMNEYFADLIDREPPLPDHLKAMIPSPRDDVTRE